MRVAPGMAAHVPIAPLPRDVRDRLDDIWSMVPFLRDVPDVRLAEM